MNTNSFELLLVKDKGIVWEVLGITYSNAMKILPGCSTLRATLFAIEECKKALAEGKQITISKVTEYSEVQPHELVIEEKDELERYKNIAVNTIAAKIQQLLVSVSILDLMSYLDSYMAMLNAGYYITDDNREDKYFEIVEQAQENEDPGELDSTKQLTFKEQQVFFEKKQKYISSQKKLKLLETYLNVYDKLHHYKSIVDFLTETRNKVDHAQSKEEIDQLLNEYLSTCENYGIVK